MKKFENILICTDLDGTLLITNDLFRGMEVIDGHIVLPDRPGIGILPL